MEMKQCPNCGKQVPAEAALCPACMTELTERTVVPQPKQRPRWLLPAAGILLLLLALSPLVFSEYTDSELADPLLPEEAVSDSGSIAATIPDVPSSDTPSLDASSPASDSLARFPTDHAPQEENSTHSTPAADNSGQGGQKAEADPESANGTTASGSTYDNGSNQVVYSDGEDTFYITSHFTTSDDPFYLQRESSQYFSMTAGAQASGQSTTQSRVTVWDGQNYSSDLRQRFWDKMESFSATVSDMEGTNVICVKNYQEDHSDLTTAYIADIGVLSYGKGRICWEFTMKNGDQIRLYTHINTGIISELELRPTAQEVPDLVSLRTYIDSKTAGMSPETIVYLYLPDVAYEGDLVLQGKTFYVYGSGGNQRTVLKGTLTLGAEPPQQAQIRNIDFVGSGGTGLVSSKGVSLYSCTFTGYNVAVDWQDQAWVRMNGCTFRNNQIALKVNNFSHRYEEYSYENNTFDSNGTALQFLNLTCDGSLSFAGCRFTGNGTDIDNPAGAALDISGAVFE